MQADKGIISALADMSFSRHVAAPLIRVFYPLVIAVLVNITSFWLLLAWWLPEWVGWAVKLAIAVLAPLTALAVLILARVVLEYLIVVFAIDVKLGVLVERTEPAPPTEGKEHTE